MNTWSDAFVTIATKIKTLEYENFELKQQHKADADFSEMLLKENVQKENTITNLMAELEALKDLIPHQVDERG